MAENRPRDPRQARWDAAAREYNDGVMQQALREPGKEWITTSSGRTGWVRNPIAEMEGWDLI